MTVEPVDCMACGQPLEECDCPGCLVCGGKDCVHLREQAETLLHELGKLIRAQLETKEVEE